MTQENMWLVGRCVAIKWGYKYMSLPMQEHSKFGISTTCESKGSMLDDNYIVSLIIEMKSVFSFVCLTIRVCK